MKRLYLIRHGATAGNLERRYIGRTDEPLCSAGEEQARRLAAQGLRAERLFVSPALRAVQTARILFPDQPYTVVEGLAETDFGIFEGKTAQELWENQDYRTWVESGCLGAIPGGEEVLAFKARCRAAFVQAVRAVPPGGTAAVITHGGVIMAVLEEYARPKRDFYDYHIENGGFFFCVWQNGTLLLE